MRRLRCLWSHRRLPLDPKASAQLRASMLSFSESSLSKTGTVRRITKRLTSGRVLKVCLCGRLIRRLTLIVCQSEEGSRANVRLYARLGLVSVKVSSWAGASLPSSGRSCMKVTGLLPDQRPRITVQRPVKDWRKTVKSCQKSGERVVAD